MVKKLYFLMAIVILLGSFLLPAQPASASNHATPAIDRDSLYVPGEVLVVLDPSIPASRMVAKANALADQVGAVVVESFQNQALLSMDELADVPLMVDLMASLPGVNLAQPNYVYWIPENNPLGDVLLLTDVSQNSINGETITRPVETLMQMRSIRKVNGRTMAVPTYPPDSFNNWGFSHVGADIVWSTTKSSPTVCIVDTGVDSSHPDLSGRIIKGYDFVNYDSTPNDDNGHGTHLAGIIAAKPNNGIGLAGISNGKVLAVKSLNAQGWGTSYAIGRGIRYCADNASVKVINLSLGSTTPDPTLYQNLVYAINTKGKLVVAAAGNDGQSYIEGVPAAYPAGWAITDTLAPDGSENTIANGLLSVAAVRAPGDYIWVDIDEDGVEPDIEDHWEWSSEHFQYCAAPFSNYGKWVEMIAPGMSIYSTTPASYPFYENWWHGATASYDTWDGTSMSASYVAGGAAHVWSFYPSYTNIQLHDRLRNTSAEYFNGYVDEHTDLDFIDRGYVDDDEDGIKYAGAPYCWPIAEGPFTENQSMQMSSWFNIAYATQRGGILLRDIDDATTGLPLKDAYLTVQTTSGTTIDTAKTSNGQVDLINIPSTYATDPPVYYNIKISKSGYTNGYQTVIANKQLYYGGISYGVLEFNISLAPARDIQIVLNWIAPWPNSLYVWLPETQHVVVGPWQNFFPSTVGEIGINPFAQWHREGDAENGKFEAITVKKNPSGSYPYYPGEYVVIMEQQTNPDNPTGYASEGVIRIWQSGSIRMLVKTTAHDCGMGPSWVLVGKFYRNGKTTSFEPINECTDDVANIWPYSFSSTIYSIFNP